MVGMCKTPRSHKVEFSYIIDGKGSEEGYLIIRGGAGGFLCVRRSLPFLGVKRVKSSE